MGVSRLSQVKLPDESSYNLSVPFVVGTGSTAGTWLGSLEGLTEYYDGLLILYKPSVKGATTTTLNINNLGAKTCYLNNTTKLTTHFPVNQPILLAYSTSQNSGCWECIDNYDSNSDTYDRNRYKANIKAGTSALVAGNIIVGKDGVFNYLKSGGAFDISYPILYLNGDVAANSTTTNIYDIIHFTVTTTQSINLTAYLPVYIKGTLSGSIFTPVSATPLTQTVPVTADNYYYMYLGNATAATTIYLQEIHPIYAYKNGKFGQIVNDASSVNGHTVDVDVTSDVVYNEYEDNDVYISKIVPREPFEFNSVKLNSITGASVVWNQLVNENNYSMPSSATVSGRNVKLSGTGIGALNFIFIPLASRKLNLVSGHKYLITGMTKYDGVQMLFYNGTDVQQIKAISSIDRPKNLIVNATISGVAQFYLNKNATAGDVDVDVTPDLIDLTALFGNSAIADYVYSLEQNQAGSGIAWLQKYGFFTEEYYAYSANTIQSVSVSGHKVVGFNQWDGTKFDGYYINSSGVKTSAPPNLNCSCTDFIKVIPNTQYYFKGYVGGASGIYAVAYYDSNKTFLSKSNGNAIEPFTFTTPTNCYYIVCNVKNDLFDTFCINISSSKNGQYKPYHAETTALDHTEQRGIFKLDANNNLYADGDIYNADGSGSVKYVEVDMGSIDYIYSNNAFRFIPSDGIVSGSVGDNADDFMCSYYPIQSNKVIAAQTLQDMYCAKTSSGTNCSYYFKNSNYTTIESFKTAMAGQKFIYKLATPTTATLTPFNPFSAIESGGIEEFIDYGVEQGIRDVAIPPGVNSIYNNSKTIGAIFRSHLVSDTSVTASNALKVNGHTVGVDVPSDAVFTDHVYTGTGNISVNASTNVISTTAEVNQNAFSNVKVGSTTVAADIKTDTLELAGSNVTLTPDATNDKVTIGITSSNVTTALGYTPYNSTNPNGYTKVESSTNGKIKINGTDTTVYTHPGSGTNPHGTTAADVGAIPTSSKGTANGIAELDANGLVPTSQLPSFVDDVLEYSSQSAFPATGETGKIYVALDTNLTYRWSGTAYVEISPSLALGETSSTAYRGDRGKIAYDHSQSTHARTDATAVSFTRNLTSGTKIGAITIDGTKTNLYCETNTDTAVTSSANHYTPATASGQDKTASASGATEAWSIDVVKGVTLNTDGKGHVTGLSVTSGKIPAKPSYSAADVGAAASSHTHGNIANGGTISSTAVTPANTDYLLISDASNSGKIERGVAIGTGTTKFLREDGSWQTPAYPTVNDKKLTFKLGTTDKGNFTANSASDKTVTFTFTAGTTPSTVTKKTVVTGATFNTVVTSCTPASASYADGVLTITNGSASTGASGSASTGDSVTVTAGTAPSLALAIS